MINVTLAKMWFAPGGQRWRAGKYEDFPSHLVEHLPSDSVVNDGSGPKPVKEFLEGRKGKRLAGKTEISDFDTNLAPAAVNESMDPGAPGSKSTPEQQVAASGESESPASPRSSGPATQALPGQEVKTGEMTTASGTKPEEKAVEKAAAKAEPKKKGIDL